MDWQSLAAARLAPHAQKLGEISGGVPDVSGYRYLELKQGCTLPPGVSARFLRRARDGVNHLLYAEGELGDVTLEFEGPDNLVVLGPDPLRKLKCRFHCPNASLVVLEGGNTASRFNVVVYDPRSMVFVGRGCTSNDTTLTAGGGRHLLLGDDCMLSWGVYLRNTDVHAVIDLATGEVRNAEADTVLGRHVWVGADAWVNKGCTVGNGSIVAKGAVVTRDVPPHCAAAGTPARVNAENVGWSRSSPARITPQEVERIRRMAQQG